MVPSFTEGALPADEDFLDNLFQRRRNLVIPRKVNAPVACGKPSPATGRGALFVQAATGEILFTLQA